MARSNTLSAKRKKDLAFYIGMLAFPILQFLVFYVAVNANSIFLAFKSYDTKNGYSFAGFENFRKVFFDLFQAPDLSRAWANSLLLYFVTTVVGVSLGLLFSFYIYKKLFFHNGFKILLFLPSILSAIVMALLYKLFCENAVPAFAEKLFGLKGMDGLFANPRTVMPVILFYNIWMGLGTSILMYTGAMGGVSESLSESARLDGCSLLQEFWHITLPGIYPTVVTFLVINLVGIFTNQMHLFSLQGAGAESVLWTYGYYLFKETQRATVAEYPYLSAMGLVFTIVVVPVTLALRRLLLKYGPSPE